MNNLRTAQVLISNEWQDINFKDIKDGQKFRLFEPDGKVVQDNRNGDTEFITASDSYLQIIARKPMTLIMG